MRQHSLPEGRHPGHRPEGAGGVARQAAAVDEVGGRRGSRPSTPRAYASSVRSRSHGCVHVRTADDGEPSEARLTGPGGRAAPWH